MKYIALLRGINAGKERRVEMKTLKTLFESFGYSNVSTYINSGNVLFEARGKQEDLRKKVEMSLKKDFGFEIPTLIKTEKEIIKIADAIPNIWQNNTAQRSDVAYLFPEIDSRKIIDELPIKKEFIDIRYVKGAIIWNVDRKNYNKSHLNKIISHKLYQFMTVRNVNTARFLAITSNPANTIELAINKMNKKILNYYTKPGKMTSFSKPQLEYIKKLPTDINSLVKVVQGLVIHQFTAFDFYNTILNNERADREGNLREVSQILEAIIIENNKPLSENRSPEQRVIGVCHHFAKLLVSILRAKGIPARMRYGFGGYFNPGYFEDHSLCEYWNEKEKRWILVDPQFDSIWKSKLHIKHNIFDVPRNVFLTPSEAWKKCRNGELDPKQFGTVNGNMHGLWFIAGNLIKDIASLNKMEMLQWDAWTGMPRPNNTMKDKKRIQFFDRLSELLSDTDTSFEEIQKLYKSQKNSIQVPKRVFNAMRRHLEVV